MSVVGDDGPSSVDMLTHLDEAPVKRYHWRTVVTMGTGFFTDAYDLFVIGIVTTILTPVWHLTTWQISLINSTALLSACFGALLFGYLMDRLGRRTMYGVEALLLTVGAAMSAFSGNLTWLLISRFVLGIGVGGDYPASAVIVSEFANRSDRGRLVTHVFAMQGLGLVAGPLVASVVLASGLSPEPAAHILLGLGTIPALAVFYLRRRMTETPRFTLHVEGNTEKTAAIVRTVTGKTVQVSQLPRQRAAGQRTTFADKPFAKRLFATALSWFLIDVAFYGNGLSSHLIIGAFLPRASIPATTALSLVIFAVTALPGYYMAAWKMDKTGRRSIQARGFVVMAVSYVLIAVCVDVLNLPVLLLAVYGVSYFFIEYGPNTTTFLYPSEMFPTHLRGQGHGIAAAGGKLGAFLAAFLFPSVMHTVGMPAMFLILGATSLLGAWLTLALLPEPKRRALEELNGYLNSESVHHTYTSIMQSLHEEGLGEAVCLEMQGVSGAELVVLHQLSEDGMILRPTACRSSRPALANLANRLTIPVQPYLHEPRSALSSAEETMVAALTRKEIVVHNDLPHVPHRAMDLHSIASFPLIAQEAPFGLLSFWDRESLSFPPERVARLAPLVQVATLALISSRQYTEVRRMAFTDALTHLPNRLGFEQELERRLSTKGGEDVHFAFAILDLDHFKILNDTHGHQQGDKALEKVGESLRTALEPGDLAARLGGDEFILFLKGVKTAEEATMRLKAILRKLLLGHLRLGVSAGISLYPGEGRTYQELYRVADGRLYAAKEGGRNRVVAIWTERRRQR